MATNKTAKIKIDNVNHPGRFKLGAADMYEAMKRAFLKVLPKKSPGLTEPEIRERLIAYLPEKLFPERAKAGWWAKTVQLDLEAKGIVARRKPSLSAGASHDVVSRLPGHAGIDLSGAILAATKETRFTTEDAELHRGFSP